MTKPGDWVFDPFVGTGTTIIAALKNGRNGAGAEITRDYVEIAQNRIDALLRGELRTRPMTKPVFDPNDAGGYLTTPPWDNAAQRKLFQKQKGYSV